MTLASEAVVSPTQERALLRSRSGDELPLPGSRWLDPVTEADRDALARVISPVLDVGCGPGRHTEALARRGNVVLGVDLSSGAIDLCRNKGLAVLERSIFASIPKAGEWASALLLDGNVGIGGNPARLLAHVASLLRPKGRIIVELSGECGESESELVCLEIGDSVGPWFEWGRLCIDELDSIATATGLRCSEVFERYDRCFAVLESSP